MKKHARLMLVVIVGLMALAYPAWRWLTPAHRITTSSFQQIREGMTQSEVETIFGVRPGDYSEGPNRLFIFPEQDIPPCGRCETWRATNAWCQVYFDHDGKSLFYSACELSQWSWFYQIKGWLGL